MTEIRSINALRAERENDNKLLSPLECLEDAAEDVRSGKVPATKVLVLCLDTGPEDTSYNVHFHASKLRASEMLALLEVFKQRVLRDMGY